jgi:ubiquinone/menaquinone biosynthesis C-methylase UbiE
MSYAELRRKIKAYYTDSVNNEWRRLTTGAISSLEFNTTMRFLNDYLPKKGIILDAGSGPGRYAFTLAEYGYKIMLFDYTPANLAFAKRKIKRAGMQKSIIGAVEGSLVDLSAFQSNHFDAVMCLGGPLSHVVGRKQRQQAAKEIIRVAKRGAPIFVSVMNKMSAMVGFVRMFRNELAAPYFENYLKNGDYPGGYGFTAYHGFEPKELQDLFAKQGAKVLATTALEGYGSYSEKDLSKLRRNKKLWKIWLSVHNRTITHPSSIGISQHIMVVCRKV